MKNSCAWKPKVRDSQGNVQNSKLFDNLLSAFSNERGSAKKHYYVATHKDFIEEYRDVLEFDEFDEVTIDSYKRVTKWDVDEELLIQNLNNSYNSGNYGIDEAIRRSQEFNKSDFGKEFIMSIAFTDKNNARIFIEKRTEQNEAIYYDILRNRNLILKLINLLESKGVNVAFLDGKDTVAGRYSTENVGKAVNGLYSLIEIYSGNGLVSEVLAEEAGHFLFGAMRNDVLAMRLYNMLTADVIKQLGYSTDILDEHAQKVEIAGRLLGEYLLLKKQSPFSILLERIVNKGRKLIANIKKNDVMRIEVEAREDAIKLVQSFTMTNNKNVLAAIKIRETLYSSKSNEARLAFQQTQMELSVMLKNLSKINYSIQKKYKEKYEADLANIKGALNSNTRTDTTDTYFASSGIVTTLSILVKDYYDIRARLNNVSEYLKANGDLRTSHYNTIQEARALFNCMQSILPIVKEALKNKVFVNEHLIEQATNLHNALYNLVGTINSNTSKDGYSYFSFKAMLEDLELDAYSLFLEKTLGAPYVERARRVVFEGYRIKRAASEKVKIKEYLSSAHFESEFEEDTILGYFLQSFGNIKDVSMQVFDSAVSLLRRRANIQTLQIRSELQNLYDRLYDIQGNSSLRDKFRNPVDPAKYYETDENGKFTGNIMQSVHWGKWEKDLKQYIQECKREFEENYKDRPEEINTYYRRTLLWNDFYKNKILIWHESHSLSYEDKENNKIIYTPAIGGIQLSDKGVPIKMHDYTNHDYKNLSAEEKEWIADFIALKTEVDNYLGRKGHTRPYRLPQFRGDVIDRVKNSLGKNDSSIKKGTKYITELLTESFVGDSIIHDYGSDETNEDIEDNYLEQDLVNLEYGRTIDKVPLYGINRLKETHYQVIDSEGVVVEDFINKGDAKKFLKESSKDGKDYSINTVLVEDLSNISRDLMHSMLLYTSMACNYKSLLELATQASIGGEVYKKRYIAHMDGKLPEKFKYEDFNFLGSYSRFSKYIKKAVFNKYNSTKIGHLNVAKIAKAVSQLTSFSFIGGNVFSGAKDLIGKLEGFYREAGVEEYFDREATNKALEFLRKNMVEHILNFGLEAAEDPISLFRSYFNISGGLDTEIKEYRPTKSRARKIFEESPWIPMTASSVIEILPYLSLAYSTKVINAENGEVMYAMEAYSKDTSIKHGGLVQKSVLLTSTGNAEEDKANYAKHKMLVSILSKLQPFQDSKENFADIMIKVFNNLSVEESDFVKANYEEYSKNPKMLYSVLNREKESLEFRTVQEGNYIESTGLTINHRISGIYDRQSRTAFQDSILGMLAFSMRGYFSGIVGEGMLNTDRFNVKLRKEDEGVHVTMIKVLLDCLTNPNIEEKKIRNVLKVLLSGFTPKAVKKAFKFLDKSFINANNTLNTLGYSEHQINNIKRQGRIARSLLDMYVLSLVTYILSLLLYKYSGADTPDDEDDSTLLMILYKLMSLTHYVSFASFTELEGIYNPIASIKTASEMVSLNAFTPFVALGNMFSLLWYSSLEVIEGLDKLIYRDDPIDWMVRKDKNGNLVTYKDENGETKYLYKSEYAKSNPGKNIDVGDSKALEIFSKMMPYWKSADAFRDPLKASDNLEHFRVLKFLNYRKGIQNALDIHPKSNSGNNSRRPPVPEEVKKAKEKARDIRKEAKSNVTK